MSGANPHSVLVIETAFLGDVVLSLALAVKIKSIWPVCDVTYLVRPDATAIVAACSFVDNVIAFDKRGEDRGKEGLQRIAAELNTLGFDTVFLLHSSMRSQLLCSAIKAEKKIGFSGNPHAALTAAVRDEGWTYRFERPQLLLQALGVSPTPFALPLLAVDSTSGDNSRKVVLAPGSVWPTKRWPASRFLELASRLHEMGYEVHLIGGKDEVAIGKEAEMMVPGAVSHCGLLSMKDSAGVIAGARVLVSNDSAPAHLALAVGTPVVEIFGPTVPSFGFAPPKENGTVVEIPMWCRPCTSHGGNNCPIHSHACMEQISVDAVLRSALPYLS